MELLWAICFWVFGVILSISTGGIGLISMLLGFIVGVIAKDKGRGFWGWSLWGMLLFIIALPHVLLSDKLNGIGEFCVDGTLEGIPFQRNKDKTITARVDGAYMHFRSYDALLDFLQNQNVSRIK